MNAMNGRQTKLLLGTAPKTPEPLTLAEPKPRPTTLEGIARRDETVEGYQKFDWNNDPAVAIAEQPRTAIYWNALDQLVIRQERSPLEEDDHLVFFNQDCLRALVFEIVERGYVPGIKILGMEPEL